MTTTAPAGNAGVIARIRALPPQQQRALIALLRGQGVDLSGLGEIMPGPRPARVPLSFAQQRLWFLAELEGTSAHYNVPMAIRLRGDLDRDALLRAVTGVVDRHESLRTRFVAENGVPHQVIDDGGGFAVTEEELTDPAELAAICREEAVAPFALDREPPIRVRLLRAADDDHVLLVTMHHSASDGWSLGVFFREIIALYEGSPLPPLPIQYADFALWQRRWLVDEVLDQQVGYWSQRLRGVNSQLTLPPDRPRPAVRGYTGAHEPLHCPAGLLTRLRELAEERDVTLYMVLLAAFAVLLHRYTGETDIPIGSPVAGRNKIELEDLIGFFVNTLVMRTDTSGDPSFGDLLGRVKELALGAYDHQDVPFEALVEALKLDRSRSHAPLFQVLFVLQERQTERAGRLGQVTATMVDADYDIAKFDLTLDVRETPDGLAGSVEYNTALYDRSTIRLFGRRYLALLAAIAADPGARISALDVLDDAEREQLAAWNDTARPFSADRCLHQLFEDVAAEHPERTAVVSGDVRWTYAELDARANRIANALRRAGVTTDSVVGLCMRRAPEMVSGILGIQKAGAAYLPVEPTYPAARIEQLIVDSGAAVVLAQPGIDVPGPAVVLTPDGCADLPSDPPEPDGLTSGCLAYVIYTSGSTGRPKGVMIEHRAAVNRIEWMQNEYGLTADDVVVQKTPFSFDVSVWEFFWPLLTGARLVVADPDGHKDPGYLISLIRDEGVTTAHFVPSMLRQVVADPGWARCTSLRRVICSGEALPPALCTEHYARNPAPLHNLYGPTEAAVDVTHWPCPADEPVDVVPIGRPIQNIQLHVLNGALVRQGVGCVGQLHIAGAGLARGYRGNPGLTDERFVPDPFAAEPGARMYATGDLARWRPDGTLEFLGRVDDQVKLRGFRIEPGEIERVLAGHPAVASCVVVVRDERLVGYVVAPEGPGLRDELDAHLRAALPEYMVPSAFVTLDAIPVNANGKLDRTALPAPGLDAYGRREYAAPATPTEQALAEEWRELLGFDDARIGRHDNLFALGGHSLMITVLVARLRERGIDATVRAIFDAPTLGDLAAALDAAGPAGPAYAVPENRIPPGCTALTPDLLPLVSLTAAELAVVTAAVPGGAANIQDVYPLVPSQEGILFHHLMSRDGVDQTDPYVIPILLGAPDEDTAERFVAALRSLVARHDVMRTAFVTEGLAEPVQVVLREAELPVERIDLAPGADVRALLAQPSAMALHEAPLIRLTVATDPASPRRFLLLRAHHLIEDATSLRLILDELMNHVAGRVERIGPVAPYRDFVAHTLHQLSTVDAEAHFTRHLDGITETTAPYGLTEVHGDGSGVREVRRTLDAALADGVRAQAKRLRTSPAAVFHAAWALVVAAASGPGGRDDVVFGTVLSGRLQGVPGVERMLGNFINTLPMRVTLRGRTVAGLLAEVDTALRDLITHEQTSLTLAQRCAGLGPDTPLFTSMINFRHFERGDDDYAALAEGLGIEWVGSVDRTNYPMGVSIDDTGSHLSVDAQVDASVPVEAVLDQLESAVAGIVAALAADDGDGTLAADIDVLTEAERHRLLVDRNATDAPYPARQCLPDLFEEQARLRPDAIAVEHGEDRLTYARTNALANRVAHWLRGQGVGPDTLVGLHADRSLDMVIGLLGILKAGGAYVPLDAAYPPDRVRSLVASCGAEVVLSRSALSGAALDGVRVLDLDTGRLRDGTRALDEAAEHDPERPGLTPDHLAYLIFTSGSTGVPKGVLVEQRGVVRLVRNPVYCPADEDTAVLQHSSLSFDVAAQEVLSPLTAGGRLVLHNGDSRDAGQLLDTVQRADVTSMCLSAAFLPAFADAARGRDLPLRLLCVGGEAFSARDVRTLYAARPELTVLNGYGPTENSIASTCHPVPRDIAKDAVIPIGAPIANSTVYVTDRELRLVPSGAVGELCVGGDGVARGYHGDEELTRSRFVANPFAPGRLYRTGDLVRWLPDGVLEFVGRVDDQLKLRGFRVEPGEVESVLRAHPAVHAASVGAQAAGETKRLVAHVQPTTRWLDAVAAEQIADRVSGWRDVFEQEYSADTGSTEDDGNLVGWNSSYTGEPVPADQMQEWIDGTVERITALRPRRLLEVGCGTGLLLFRYAGACESVHAIDLSAAALAGVERGVRRRGWSHVTLERGDALSVAALAGQEFDTIVVNSVVQYFPNRYYLDEVIGRLLPLLTDGGKLLLGDIRNADLFTAHLTAVERGTSGAALTAAALADRVRRRRRQEPELLVSPGHFTGLPGFGAVDIMVKRGLGDNEMLSYRYDVVLTKGAAREPEALPWVPVEGVAELRDLLADPPHQRFGVSGLVNPRVADDVAVAAALERRPGHRRVEATGADRLTAAATEAVYELEETLDQAERLGFRVAVTWAQDRPDGLDLVLGRDELPPVLAKDPYPATEPANTPQIGRISAALGRELRAHLAERVPEHMVPSVFVAVESMPITANGKVDRRALPEPDDGDVAAESYVPPGTGTERLLCELVQDVLGLARVGVHDTFFGLGGHSLLATRLTIRVRQELGKPLPLRDVLSGATIAELAAALDADETEAGAEVRLAPVGATAGPDPLSLQQRELWFRNRISHLGAGHDNVQLAFRLLGPLDRRAYEGALRAVLDRHSVLRTGYPVQDGTVTPTVHDAAGFAVITEHVPDDAAVTEFLRAERTRPFDPAGPYPLRVHLLVLHEHEHVVVVTRPWGIFDGWSTGIFFADLDTAYRALATGAAPALPPLPVQYRDFAHWQRAVVGEDELARQHEYWRRQLAGLPAGGGLRTDYRRPPVKSYQGSTVSFTVPAELAERLRAIGAEHGASLYLTLLTAFAVLLGGHTEDAEVVVGSPVTNRPRPELEGLIGYFVNVLPLRLPTGADRPFTELLDEVRRVSSAAQEHKDVPFADVAAALVPEPDPARPPLCQVMFNLIPAPRGADRPGRAAGELTMLPCPAPPGTAKFDLNLVVQDTPAGLTGLLEYSTDLFARASAERMAELYQRLLRKIGARPAASPARLRADAAAGLDG